MDWKEQLLRLKEEGGLPEGEETPASAPAEKPATREKLRIMLDKKGRHGKTATLIEGFLCDDAELKEIAAGLKQRLGTGGSSRDGEILLQGDWREKAAAALRERGHKVTVV